MIHTPNTRVEMLRYAITGKEFDVMDELTKLGIKHWRGTRVEFERRGKSRTPDAYDYPAMPNYIWCSPLSHQIHLMRDVKYLTPTFLFLTRADIHGQTLVYEKGTVREREVYKGGLLEFVANVEAREKEARRIVGNREAIQLYKLGEQIQIKEGPFAGKLARFAKMVQTAADLFPQVEADVEMFGGMTRVRFDPLAVDKLKSA